MYQPMNVELAIRLGMASAVCAECLKCGIEGGFAAETEDVKGTSWIRMGHRQLSLLIPYLTPHMTKSALRRLVNAGVLKTFDLNDSPFDHTHWYAFTGYGQSLMDVTGEEDK